MKGVDELRYYGAGQRAERGQRQFTVETADTASGSLSNANHRSQSSRSPSDASLLVLVHYSVSDNDYIIGLENNPTA